MLNDMLAILNSFDWDDSAIAFQQVEDLLRKLDLDRVTLSNTLRCASATELLARTRLSHETSTHYKWFVYRDEQLGYSIWLHEYKPASLRRAGYAEIPHNHRYWFSSLLLRGGFSHLIYSVDRVENDADRIDRYQVSRELPLREGDTYTFKPSVIHSLKDIREPTYSLVIRGRGVTPFSESFDLKGNSVVRFTPFSERLSDYRRIVQSIAI